MSEPPLVSVVIPTRNRRTLVTRAIESARAQTYPSVEIIVVDDGSTDGTVEYLASQPDLRVISLTNRLGGAAARNRGWKDAAGDFVAFLDSDDEWLPDKLDQQTPMMSDRRVGAVYCRHFMHDDTTGNRVEPHVRIYRGNITEDLLAGRCPRTVSLFLVRRQALESVGGFDETLVGFQDTDLWIRMSHDWLFDAVDLPLVVVHSHAQERITTNIDTRIHAVDAFLAKWGKEMEARIGADGVARYRRIQLAVAQGTAVLDRVRTGRRVEALIEFGRYVRIAGFSNPRQLMGLLVACAAGNGWYTRAKSARQSRSGR